MMKKQISLEDQIEIGWMFKNYSRHNFFENLEANQPKDIRQFWSTRHTAGDDRNARSMKAAKKR